jgi:hypothetical protein
VIERENDCHAQTPASEGFKLDMPTVGSGDGSNDREAETVAAPDSLLVGSAERLQQAGNFGARDRRAAVGDLERRRRMQRPSLHLDVPALVVVSDGVVDEVVDKLREQSLVAECRRWHQVLFDVQHLFLGASGNERQTLTDELVKSYRHSILVGD